MTEEYSEIVQDSARGSTANTEVYDPQETQSNDNSDENLNPKNILVKIKFANGAVLELQMSEKSAEACSIETIKKE